jgi:hypothetical protein
MYENAGPSQSAGMCLTSMPFSDSNQKRILPLKHDFHGTSQARRCATPNCGGFKKSTIGERNLHYTWKQAGEPCIFYCPLKMHNKYGSPLNWSWEEFKNSEHFVKAKHDVALDKRAKEEKKKRLAEERQLKGHKKSGPQPK